MFLYKFYNFQSGYIALSSILVIGAAVTAIILSTALVSISEGQSALSAAKKEAALNLTEGCVEEALLKINQTNSLPDPVILPDGNCDTEIISQVGESWNFTVSANLAGYGQKFSVQATRGAEMGLDSWQEVVP